MEDCCYFVVKVASIQALQKCADTSIWACRDRLNPPHPRTVLTSALCTSKVILIFSVNNCHGWHGYAEMLESPKLESPKLESPKLESPKLNRNHERDVKEEMIRGVKLENTRTENFERVDGEPDESQESSDHASKENLTQKPDNRITDTELSNKQCSDVWYHFPVKWEICFIKEFGEQCLSSKLTEHLMVSDTLCLNKARNWQEVPSEVGVTVCSLIDQFYSSLCEKRQLQYQKVLDKQDDPFFKEGDGMNDACEETWNRIVEKVEAELGPVILACPFGSQRYNLSIPSSDTDMFIVYQGKTKDLLGFHPPKQTIKNSERESCDYTIHEAFRYAELLLSGDARCVETLFVHKSTVVKSSCQWQEVREGRHHLLNQETLNKYLRDAQGTRGTKQLKKWCVENASETVLPKKMCKLLYVIVRLLQNARDIVYGKEICVFRENNSEDRTTLMSIRQGGVTVERAWEIIRSLESEIERYKERVPEKHSDTETFLENWLLNLRKTDFVSEKD